MLRSLLPLIVLSIACDGTPEARGLDATASEDVLVPGTPGQPMRERVAVQPRRAHEPMAEAGVEAEEGTTDQAEARQRIVIDGPGVSPLFGRDLAETAKGLERLGGADGEDLGLAARGDSLAHEGGKVEPIEIPAPPEERPPPGAITGNPGSWPSMSMPSAKSCRAPAVQEVSEGGTSSRGGLTAGAFRRGINGVAPRAYGCFPASTSGTVRATAWVVAGCDGRASSVEVESRSDLPDAVVDCIEHVLGHAAFPAHGLPDGQEAMIPLTFRL